MPGRLAGNARETDASTDHGIQVVAVGMYRSTPIISNVFGTNCSRANHQRVPREQLDQTKRLVASELGAREVPVQRLDGTFILQTERHAGREDCTVVVELVTVDHQVRSDTLSLGYRRARVSRLDRVGLSRARRRCRGGCTGCGGCRGVRVSVAGRVGTARREQRREGTGTDVLPPVIRAEHRSAVLEGAVRARRLGSGVQAR